MERSPENSHGSATGFTAPFGVEINPVAPESSIGEMLEAGELDAAIHYIAASNTIDRSRYSVDKMPRTRLLFADPVGEAARYHAKTGLLPMNHCVVIRATLAETYNYLAGAVFDAFTRSKEIALRTARVLYSPVIAQGLADQGTFERDPLPYGMATQELGSVNALAEYLVYEGLAVPPLAGADLFELPGPA
jgi:4,5-dihydroxyphthalate decarboxylase